VQRYGVFPGAPVLAALLLAARVSSGQTERKTTQGAENAQGGAMTESRDPSLEAQITSKMHELIGCMCVVNFKKEGDRRGIIERIESLALGKDFAESFERTGFRVHLTSGEVVIVSGSAIPAIESTSAGSGHAKKKQNRRARKAKTEMMPQLNATKASQEAIKARARGTKERPAKPRRAKVKQNKAK
jgi:hypothetical protein